MNIRSTATAGLLAAGLLLGGCASLNVLDSDVNSYSQWPAQRVPATYAYERLPSQQARPLQQEELEAAARDALAKAGFRESSDAAAADVTVQVGARISRYDSPYGYDPFPFYGYGGYGWYGRRGIPAWGWGPAYGMGGFYDSPRYEREVGVLIRDRQSGQVLYESRASNDGLTSGGTAYLAAMFEAALKDFPQPAVNPRRVSIPLASAQGKK